jgi:glycosyltransferase involved in cell wall biosynthesis
VNYNLTIVTVTKNDSIGLRETTLSILNLASKAPELSVRHLIMDGNSKDTSFDCWQQLTSEFRGTNYLGVFSSNDDSGIYDAMNNALHFFKDDDIVWYLNAGDVISDGINSRQFLVDLENFKSSESILIFFIAKCRWGAYEWHIPPKRIDGVDFANWITGHTPVHQAVLFKFKSAIPLHYLKVFKIQADTILIYYLMKLNSDYILSKEIICVFFLGGLSGNYTKGRKVLRQTIEQYFVYALRKDRLYKYFSLPFIMLSKYILSNILGVHFYKIHSILNKMRFK